MKGPRMVRSAELILAAILLGGALVVDFLWYRPQEEAYRQTTAQELKTEEQLSHTRRERIQSEDILRYLAGGREASAWREIYAAGDPLPLLETIRRQMGLSRDDLVFRNRDAQESVVKTSYQMSVTGSFDRQIQFIKALEEATPLISVNQLTLVDLPDQPGLSLRLELSVLSVPREGE